MGLDEDKELTPEETVVREIVEDFDGRERAFKKCRYAGGAVFYLVVDENGGFQSDDLDQVLQCFWCGSEPPMLCKLRDTIP
jgi:hypothetical protein